MGSIGRYREADSFTPRRARIARAGLSGIVLALTLLMLAASAQAAPIGVDTTDDELNADGDCSLREAIEAANTNAAVDACAAGEAGPTVDLIEFSVTGTITLASELPTIADDLTIDGPAAPGITISGNDSVRVLAVVGETLELKELTVADGFAAGDGGGINNFFGTLTVTNSTFSGNSASFGGAISNSRGSTLTITDSTFSGNGAAFGGAISNGSGTLTVTNSTFSGNTASSSGGGIFNEGTLTVTNSTFSGNSASSGGGGIRNFNGTATLENTIVADSPSGGNCSGPITDGGGNLSWPDTTCPGINEDPLLDPAGLGDNGGPTETIALEPESPALDAADETNCPAADQRGVGRPQGAGCDIGAFELQIPTTLTLAPASDTNAAGEPHCLVARALDAFSDPVPELGVVFAVHGPNFRAPATRPTGPRGYTRFCYTGQRAGTDTVRAFADTNESGADEGAGEPEASATKTYTAAAPDTLSLSPSEATNATGTEHCVTATVHDRFDNPTAGRSVIFTVSGENDRSQRLRTTNVRGRARLCYVGQNTGEDTIRAFADTNADTDRDPGEPGGIALKTWVAP